MKYNIEKMYSVAVKVMWISPLLLLVPATISLILYNLDSRTFWGAFDFFLKVTAVGGLFVSVLESLLFLLGIGMVIYSAVSKKMDFFPWAILIFPWFCGYGALIIFAWVFLSTIAP